MEAGFRSPEAFTFFAHRFTLTAPNSLKVLALAIALGERCVTEYESTTQPGAEKRRSTRIIKSIPITVVGDDALGQPFRESTNTVMINCYGCKYQSVHYVPKSTTVTVDVHRSHRQLPPRTIRGKVIWVQRPRSYQDVYHIGVEFEVAGNVWSLAAPPSDWFPFPGDDEEAAQAAALAASALAKENEAAQAATKVTSFQNGGKRGGVAEEVLLVPAPSHAHEFEVDVTTELPHSAAGDTQSSGRAASSTERIRDRQTHTMREVVREIVDEKLNEHSVTMRRYFDDSLQQLLEKVYERMQKLQDESRTEMQSIREALTIVPSPAAAEAKKPRGSRKRRSVTTQVTAS